MIQGISVEPCAACATTFSGLPLSDTYTFTTPKLPFVVHEIVVLPLPAPGGTGLGSALILPSCDFGVLSAAELEAVAFGWAELSPLRLSSLSEAHPASKIAASRQIPQTKVTVGHGRLILMVNMLILSFNYFPFEEWAATEFLPDKECLMITNI